MSMSSRIFKQSKTTNVTRVIRSATQYPITCQTARTENEKKSNY